MINPGTHLILYDRTLGALSRLYALGAWLYCVLGWATARQGISTWPEGLSALARAPKPILSVQYWGHGTSGYAYLAKHPIAWQDLKQAKPYLPLGALWWWRTCASFQGSGGQGFAVATRDNMEVTAAGFTAIIGYDGVWWHFWNWGAQSGLQVLKPEAHVSWDQTEGLGADRQRVCSRYNAPRTVGWTDSTTNWNQIEKRLGV